MLFLDLDLDRDCFSDSLGSSSYFALCILRDGQYLEKRTARRSDGLPAVANHAHALGFGLTVELGALLEILLAPDTLSVAETCLGESIDITPG